MSRRALVIGITRLGDLIQSEPLIRALKLHAGYEYVDILVEKSFVDVATELESVDGIVSVDFEDILRPLDRLSTRLPLDAFVRIVRTIESGHYSGVINLTHSRPSMILAALASRESEGVTLDDDGFQVVRNPWLRYFFATNLARPWCAFNLVDIYVNAVAPKSTFVERIPRLKGRLRREVGRSRCTGMPNVLLHLTASQSDKQWPQDMFNALASELIDRGVQITLIGSGNKDRGHCPIAHRRINNLIGKTSIRNLIELCDSADLMVTADSGPAHIAACLGLPVVAIEGGSAHAFETAPYGIGNLVIEPHLDNVIHRRPDKHSTSAPASRISVKVVISAVERLIYGETAVSGSHGLTVYETKSGENVPGIELLPVSGSHNEYERWQSKLRMFWYTALAGEKGSLEDGSGRFSLLFRRASQACEQVEESTSSSPVLAAAAKELTTAEQSLDGELLKHPPLHHIVAYLRIARSSLGSSNAIGQSRELGSLYHAFSVAGKFLDSYSESDTGNNQVIAVPWRHVHEDLYKWS